MNPVVQALAVARLTTLIAEDAITEPVRSKIGEWANGHPEYSFRERVSYMVTCARCASVWSGLAILLASRWRWSRPLVKILAGSQAGLFIITAVDKLER